MRAGADGVCCIATFAEKNGIEMSKPLNENLRKRQGKNRGVPMMMLLGLQAPYPIHRDDARRVPPSDAPPVRDEPVFEAPARGAGEGIQAAAASAESEVRE